MLEALVKVDVEYIVRSLYSPQTVQQCFDGYFHVAISKLHAGVERVCLLDMSPLVFNQI